MSITDRRSQRNRSLNVPLNRVLRPNNRISFRYRDGERQYVAVNRISNGRLVARDVRANWDNGRNTVRTFDLRQVSEVALHRGELV